MRGYDVVDYWRRCVYGDLLDNPLSDQYQFESDK